MVTVIRTLKEFLDLDNKYYEMRRSGDDKATRDAVATFESEYVFDTSVIHDNDTGKDELALQDLREFIKAYMNEGFRFRVLENTCKLLKNKSKKERALFVNTLMRKIGEDMRVSGYTTFLGDKKISMHNTFISNLTDGNESLLDSDSVLVYKILNVDNWNDEKLEFGSLRFDADNPLHNRLARIAMEWESQGVKSFEGFTDRWLRDTQPQAYMEQKSHAKKVANEEAAKEQKNGSVDIMAEMYEMPVGKLYDEYNHRRWGNAEELAVVGCLIDRAPVDSEWCLKIGHILPKVYSSEYYKEQTITKRKRGAERQTDATLMQDTYKVIEAFSKKYKAFLEEQKETFEALQTKYEEAHKDFEAKDKASQDLRKEVKALKYKETKWNKFLDDLGNIVHGFGHDVRTDDCSSKEKTFYTDLHKKVKSMLEEFRLTSDNAKLQQVNIDGEPWGWLGKTKEKQNRLKIAEKYVKQWNEKVQNIPEHYTEDDQTRWTTLSQNRDRVDFECTQAESRSETAKKEFEQIENFMNAFVGINAGIQKSRNNYDTMHKNAQEKLVAKRQGKPVVKSGYSEFHRTATAREKAEEDAVLAAAKLFLQQERQVASARKNEEMKRIAARLKQDDKDGKLSEAGIRNLTEEIWSKEHGEAEKKKAQRLQEIKDGLKHTNLPPERLEAYALKVLLSQQKHND